MYELIIELLILMCFICIVVLLMTDFSAFHWNVMKLSIASLILTCPSQDWSPSWLFVVNM